jgi:hypothetical protein
LDDGRGNDPLRDGHRQRVDAAGGRYLGLAPDLTSANGEPPVELDRRAFCARYFPGLRRRYDLEAVVAYGAFAAPLMRKPASNREHSTTSAAVT